MIQHNTIHNPVNLNIKSNEHTFSYNNSKSKSHLLFELYQPIAVHDNVDIYMTIENFKFTNTIYNVNEYNNILYFGIGPSYTQSSVTINQGNYNITSLVTYLNSNVGNGFTFTYDDSTYKITLTNTSDFKLFSGSNNCLDVLGLTNETHTSVSKSLTSDNIINLTGAQMLYVNIPNLALNSYGVKNYANMNTVISVPINVIQGDTQTTTSSFKHKINQNSITHLEIEIVDQNNNDVNFNNIDWYMNISFNFMYKNQYKQPKFLLDNYNQNQNDNSQKTDKNNNKQ